MRSINQGDIIHDHLVLDVHAYSTNAVKLFAFCPKGRVASCFVTDNNPAPQFVCCGCSRLSQWWT